MSFYPARQRPESGKRFGRSFEFCHSDRSEESYPLQGRPRSFAALRMTVRCAADAGDLRRARCFAAVLAACFFAAAAVFAQRPAAPPQTAAPPVAKADVAPDSKHSGGEPDGVVQVANLVYATTKSSKCFSDHFLVQAEKDSSISTSRRFHAVKLAGDDIYEFPLLIMTGEGDFHLSERERDSLRRYLQRGGFLLASASCSSAEWDRSFRREMALVFPRNPLKPISLNHPVFHTVYDIKELKGLHAAPRSLEGITLGPRLGVIYSRDGLNDTSHTEGCCCCGGNEILNCVEINVNVLAYALTY